METVACNLCRSTRHTALYQMPDRRGYHPGVFTVVECNQCGLGFLNPRPPFADMGKYYPKEYYEEEFAQNRAYHLPGVGCESETLSGPLFLPCLKHEDVPQMTLPIPLPRKVLRPEFPDRFGPEKTLSPQSVLVQQSFRPISQRPT